MKVSIQDLIMKSIPDSQNCLVLCANHIDIITLEYAILRIFTDLNHYDH